jgi:serine protease Do
MSCVGGRHEKDHVRGAPCGGRPRRRLLMPLLGLLVGTPALVAAADPPPASFARTAAMARAASIVIRMPDAETVVGRVVATEEAAGVASPMEPTDRPDAVDGRRQRTFAGVIVDPRGLALTSARAWLRSPGFQVSLLDGTPLKTTLLAVDRRSDIAVLKLDSDGEPLPYLSLADSDRVEVGQWVIAVGAPMGLEGTVTAGVVTATPRPADLDPLAGLLQVDAVMDRGNAGGPIVAPGGEIVGLSTGISADGIGYARPSPAIRKIYLALVEQGRVSRPWLGVTTQTLTARLARALGARGAVGVLVADVPRAGPGAAAGLRSGDIVVAMNAMPLSSRAQLEHAVGALAPGRVVRLSVRRAAATLTLRVRLGDEPDESKPTPLVARARWMLGLEAAALAPSLGVVAADIEPGSPAARAGLEAGDIVREVNRRAIRTIADFEAAVRAFAPRASVLMLVQRREVALYVTLDPRP